MAEIVYPTAEKIIEYNFLAISLIKVKKADRAQVVSKQGLGDIIDECKALEGDIYDKAAFLFRQLIKRHPFVSGNRRTAFIVTKAFLTGNSATFNIENSPFQAKIMTGIREGYYSNEEIKEWLKHGKIREFKR
ncbi:MAG: type II toxin-antitoxin system death-on-curing family toxin [Candidatus Micrarchaeota archaeon]